MHPMTAISAGPKWPGCSPGAKPPDVASRRTVRLGCTRLAASLAGVGCSGKTWLVLSGVGRLGADRRSGVIRRPDGLPWPSRVRLGDQTCRPHGYFCPLLARPRHDSRLRLDDSDLLRGDAAKPRSGPGFCFLPDGLSCAGPTAVHRPEET